MGNKFRKNKKRKEPFKNSDIQTNEQPIRSKVNHVKQKEEKIYLSNYPLGIDNYDEWYVKILSEQNSEEEFSKVNKFVHDFCIANQSGELEGNQRKYKFINWGETQLVFVLTIDESKQFALLVNQPQTKAGQGLEEYNNLIYLNKIYPDIIIKPIQYYVNPNNPQQELYVTPYYFQARCVGVETTEWGMWVPEPRYYFRNYTEIEKKVINKCMVALAIKFYDEKNKNAISGYKFDGGDFILKKGYENYEINEENIIKNMIVIAARKLIQIELNDYIEKMKHELRNEVDGEKIVIGEILRCPFSMEDIEEGIKLGMKLREDMKNE